MNTKYIHLATIAEKTNHSLSELENKVVVLNFGFAACIPCIEELEGLKVLYNKFTKYPQFQFLSFTFDDENTIQTMVDTYNLPYRPISVPVEVCEKLGLKKGYPTNIILSKGGLIQKIHTGGPAGNNSIEFVQSHFGELIQLLLKMN